MSRSKDFPSITLYGQRVTSLSFEDTVQAVSTALKTKKKLLIFAMNVHILLELRRKPEYKEKHNRADLIIPDGVPLLWMARMQGKRMNGRVSGTDLCGKILSLEYASGQHPKIFVVASRESVIHTLRKLYPDTVVGGYVPPFQESWDTSVTEEIKGLVTLSNADTLLVGISPLKQEKWLWEHFKDLKGVYVAMGVGSALEILTGEAPRAPELLRDRGGEWLWRVILEPRRLCKRYYKDILELMSLLITFKKK